MPSRIRYRVFGRLVDIEGGPGNWTPFAVGSDGKRRRADFEVPAFLEEHELAQYLHDLFHELATPSNCDVVQVSMNPMQVSLEELSKTVLRMEATLSSATDPRVREAYAAYVALVPRLERDLAVSPRDVALAKSSALMLVQQIAQAAASETPR